MARRKVTDLPPVERVFLPRHVEARYGVSGMTRWRWEKDGKLPPRDVHIGGKAAGWYASTIERAERGEAA